MSTVTSKRATEGQGHGPPVVISATFDVGSHQVRVTKVMEGRWSVAVDGRPLDGSFRTQADAWEVGVRESDRLDRAGASVP